MNFPATIGGELSPNEIRIMKQSIATFLIAFLWISVSSGQMPQVTVKWGPEYKGSTGKKKEQSYAIGKDKNGGFYSLREKYKSGQINKVKRFIEHFDRNGNLLRSEKIKIRHKKGDRFFDGIFFNEGRMYLVTYHLRRSDKMNVLSVQDIDPETMLVDEKIRAIAEVPYERGLFGFVNLYSLKMVNDRIYVFHAAPESKSGSTLVSIHVFDKDFNIQWKHFRSLSYQEELFQPEDFDIDQSGTVRVMASIYKDKKRKVRQGQPNYEYHFFVFANEGNDFKEHSISLGEKLITDMKFSYRPNGDIACAGFYSDKFSMRKTNTIAGAFYVILDPESSSIKHQNYKVFDQAFLSNFMTYNAAAKGKEIKNINLYDLHFLENGSAILLAEEYTEYEVNASMTSISYSYQSSSYTKTITTTTINWKNYEFDNIVVLKVNPDGVIDWVDLITKKQHTSADGGMYSSFATAYVGDKIYLIYNDNPKNLTAAPGELHRFRKNKEAVVVCAEIDYKGYINKKALFSAREAETLTCPRSCKQVAENKMEIYGKKGKKIKWGILEFH